MTISFLGAGQNERPPAAKGGLGFQDRKQGVISGKPPGVHHVHAAGVWSHFRASSAASISKCRYMNFSGSLSGSTLLLTCRGAVLEIASLSGSFGQDS